MSDSRERHRWHDGHNFRVLSDGTFQGKSPGDPEDKWQTLEGWQSPTMGREIGRLAVVARAAGRLVRGAELTGVDAALDEIGEALEELRAALAELRS